LRATGVEAESQLPFAGLHELIRPVLGAAGALAPPQRRALLSAFGLDDDGPPEPFLICLAALNLLTGVSARHPVAVIVDDLHARQMVAAVTEQITGMSGDPRYVAALAIAEPVARSQIVDTLLARASPGADDVEALILLGQAAHAIGDPVRTVSLLDRAEARLRRRGQLGRLSHVLNMGLYSRLELGDFQRARIDSDEARRLAEETKQPIWHSAALALDAMAHGLRGDNALAQELAAEAEQLASSSGLNPPLACVQLARGYGHLSAGNHAAAYRALRHHLAYARAVLADEENAGDLYLTALGSDLRCWPWLRGRLQLAFGRWLRRRQHVAEARESPRSAADTLVGIGARVWADQAETELRAAGEQTARRSAPGWETLTAQELQIVRMAGEGFSNKQIGQRLYLSPRTVSGHLYRAFPKLGITSRGQISACLHGRQSLKASSTARVSS
jgi:DNA-binding CsgD family transcriptional regulator